MNLEGEVIGMNISRVERTRSFALPADVLKQVIPKLIEEKRDVTPGEKPKTDPIEEDF